MPMSHLYNLLFQETDVDDNHVMVFRFGKVGLCLLEKISVYDEDLMCTFCRTTLTEYAEYLIQSNNLFTVK